MDIKHNFLDAKLFKTAKMPVSAVRTATILSFILGKYDNQLGFFNHLFTRKSNKIQDYDRRCSIFLRIRFLIYFCGGRDVVH